MKCVLEAGANIKHWHQRSVSTVIEQRAVTLLADDSSRQIALLKLKTQTADEIAAKLNCSRRTVQHKLLVIRRVSGITRNVRRAPIQTRPRMTSRLKMRH